MMDERETGMRVTCIFVRVYAAQLRGLSLGLEERAQRGTAPDVVSERPTSPGPISRARSVVLTETDLQAQVAQQGDPM